VFYVRSRISRVNTTISYTLSSYTLIEMDPKSVKEENIDGCLLPIHLACESGVPNIDCLKKLVEANPEALQSQSNISLHFDSSVLNYTKDDDNDDNKDRQSNESDNGGDVDDELLNSKKLEGNSWCDLFLKSPISVKSIRHMNVTEDGRESNFTPLHLAILNHAPPEAIDYLVESNEEILDLKTSKGRKPLDCAYGIIIDKTLTEDSSSEMKNSFAAIEILETKKKNKLMRDQLKETIHLTNEALQSIEDKFDAKREWGKLKTAFTFLGGILKKKSMLGSKVASDYDKVILPEKFIAPNNLEQITLDIKLPVGFRRLRWAILSSQSKFWTEAVMKEEKRYSK